MMDKMDENAWHFFKWMKLDDMDENEWLDEIGENY